MYEGEPIAYQLLDTGVPVLASGGEQVGTVASVLCAPEEDVFHGLLVKADRGGIHFVPAETIASLHEHGVDLRIDIVAARALPAPEHAAPVYDERPDEQQRWRHWAHRLTGRNDWHHER